MSDLPARHVPCQCPDCRGMADRIAELEAQVEHLEGVVAFLRAQRGDWLERGTDE